MGSERSQQSYGCAELPVIGKWSSPSRTFWTAAPGNFKHFDWFFRIVFFRCYQVTMTSAAWSVGLAREIWAFRLRNFVTESRCAAVFCICLLHCVTVSCQAKGNCTCLAMVKRSYASTHSDYLWFQFATTFCFRKGVFCRTQALKSSRVNMILAFLLITLNSWNLEPLLPLSTSNRASSPMRPALPWPWTKRTKRADQAEKEGNRFRLQLPQIPRNKKGSPKNHFHRKKIHKAVFNIHGHKVYTNLYTISGKCRRCFQWDPAPSE